MKFVVLFYYFVNPIYISEDRLNNGNTSMYNAIQLKSSAAYILQNHAITRTLMELNADFHRGDDGGAAGLSDH